MANKKNTTNKSGKKKTSGKKSRKRKNSSDDSLKFLMVLVIAGIAIALIFISGSGEKPTGSVITGTPSPTAAEASKETPVPTEEALQTPDPTKAEEMPDIQITETPVPTQTPTPSPTQTLAPTPTPTSVLTAKEAEKIVKEKVDISRYNIQLVNSALSVGNGRYYQFGAISGQEFIYPFLVVSQKDGSLYCYDSTEGTIFDFTKFPLQAEVTATPTPQPANVLTAKEAYQVLCTYPKEALKIAKEAAEYDAEYGNELTLVNGINCYRINLSELSNGKVRNRGEFYISTDGTKCFYIDTDTNEFIQAVK